MKFKYIILAVTLTSLTLLYLLAGIAQPPTIALSDVSRYDGQHVTVTGRVLTYQQLPTGGQTITIHDPATTARLTLYLTQPATITYGDTIQATGTIDQYQDTWELTIDTPRSLTLLHHDTTPLCPLWQLAQDPHTYQDTTITTTGTVDKTTQTSFTLKDTNGTATIQVYGATQQPTKGQQVLLHARFLFDPETFRYTLQLTNATALTILGGNTTA